MEQAAAARRGEGSTRDDGGTEEAEAQSAWPPEVAPGGGAVPAKGPAGDAPTPARRPRVLLAVTGSVATIKLPILARLLLDFCDVRVIATRSARYFFADDQLPDAARPALGECGCPPWREASCCSAVRNPPAPTHPAGRCFQGRPALPWRSLQHLRLWRRLCVPFPSVPR